MKRFGIAFAGVFLGSMIAGCGGGIEEGRLKLVPTDPQPQAFKNFMKENAGKMGDPKKAAGKGKMEAAAKPTPAAPEKKE